MKIAFIGLGKMGSVMVKRLLQAGHEVTVFNRSKDKMTPLVALGASPSESIGLAVGSSDVIMTSLLNDEAVWDVTKEILLAIDRKAIHIGLSTISPDTGEKIGELHQKQGSGYVSAAVLGAPLVAEKGELTTYVSGTEKDLKVATSILLAFSSHIIPLGDKAKSPLIMKTCMNYSLLTMFELVSELYVFAQKSGFDIEFVKMGLHQIYGHPSFKLYIEKIHNRDFDHANFDVIGGNKDISVFQEAFAKVGVVPELGNVIRSRFISALAQGMHSKDWSCIYEIIREQSGID